MKTRDEIKHHESLEHPIFLLQRRRVEIPQYLFDISVGYDGEGGVWDLLDEEWIDDEGKVYTEDDLPCNSDELKDYNEDNDTNIRRKLLEDDELLERGYAIEYWDVEYVAFTREEAMIEAIRRNYDYGKLGKSCRVYSVPCLGKLKDILAVFNNMGVVDKETIDWVAENRTDKAEVEAHRIKYEAYMKELDEYRESKKTD